MDRYVCVHGHFYQPPRENPWLEVVEQQDSAWPYHDWNERITAECYGPNTAARVLDDRGRLTQLVSNYARISFNVGPTLLSWMQDRAPDVHEAIVRADRESRERFGGHGSAMAQVHNHVIMPLATDRDRRTQVRWGIRDFERRFGRRPEGMWLAETAVDTATLEVLAEHGIAFTVLSPYQAARVRRRGEPWRDVRGGAVDTTTPYWVRLPSGRRLAVFFYDGPASRAVAFERLLDSGEVFAARLLSGFTDRAGPQLVHIATDGESYGHHHRYGEMALARALELIEQRDDVVLTNYGQYLELHPPTGEAEIVENSSWSCAHGIERWRSDCGCSTDAEPGWHQAWRAPLREALDWLRDELAPRFEARGRQLFTDPWAARDDYIDVVLDRSPRTVDAFLARHARRRLEGDDVVALRLLELQRHAMLMYTSCGWFFGELSRIEPVQVLFYAARAIQLAEQLFADADLTPEFLRRLAKAPSNDPELGDGRRIYETVVAPEIAAFEKVAAHFAISGLFRRYGPTEALGCYEVERPEERLSEAGRARLAYGRVTVRSTITRAEASYDYAVLHLGDHNFACGVRPASAHEELEAMAADLEAVFAKADLPGTIRTLDEHVGRHRYSLRDLFRDEQRRVLDHVLEGSLAEAEATYRNIYRGRAPLMRFLRDLGVKVPAPLRSAAEVVLNAELRDAFRGPVDPTAVRSLIDEAARFDIPLDTDGLAHALNETIRRTAAGTQAALEDLSLFDTFGRAERATTTRIEALVEVARSMPFEVDLRSAQHACYRVVHRHRAALVQRAAAGDPAAVSWLRHVDRLAALLHVAVADGD